MHAAAAAAFSRLFFGTRQIVHKVVANAADAAAAAAAAPMPVPRHRVLVGRTATLPSVAEGDELSKEE